MASAGSFMPTERHKKKKRDIDMLSFLGQPLWPLTLRQWKFKGREFVLSGLQRLNGHINHVTRSWIAKDRKWMTEKCTSAQISLSFCVWDGKGEVRMNTELIYQYIKLRQTTFLQFAEVASNIARVLWVIY